MSILSNIIQDLLSLRPDGVVCQVSKNINPLLINLLIMIFYLHLLNTNIHFILRLKCQCCQSKLFSSAIYNNKTIN